jgi:hypothetical protein
MRHRPERDAKEEGKESVKLADGLTNVDARSVKAIPLARWLFWRPTEEIDVGNRTHGRAHQDQTGTTGAGPSRSKRGYGAFIDEERLWDNL